MKDVWVMGLPKKNEKIFGHHPAQKPIVLLDRIILASTNKNDIILDPFMGSGTTGVAALLNQRQFIGIEKEEEFMKIAIKRIENIGGNESERF